MIEKIDFQEMNSKYELPSDVIVFAESESGYSIDVVKTSEFKDVNYVDIRRAEVKLKDKVPQKSQDGRISVVYSKKGITLRRDNVPGLIQALQKIVEETKSV